MSFEPYIRQVKSADDVERLLTLIDRLAEFEHLTPPDAAARRRFVHDGFERNPPRFWALLAGVGEDEPSAYAIFFETYSSFLCQPTLYLEDLFVLPEARRSGIGLALMHHLSAEAIQRGCGRMEWTCLDWNVNAQQFYDKIGAIHMSEWYFYRFERDAMERFAAKLQQTDGG